MNYTIYGLRLKCDLEARYIGQTSKILAERLRGHHTEAGLGSVLSPLGAWLQGYSEEIEIFRIAGAATRPEALRIERETVKVCLALNHRLFNQWLVPADRRIVAAAVAA